MPSSVDAIWCVTETSSMDVSYVLHGVVGRDARHGVVHLPLPVSEMVVHSGKDSGFLVTHRAQYPGWPSYAQRCFWGCLRPPLPFTPDKITAFLSNGLHDFMRSPGVMSFDIF
eukprot:139349_1